MRKASRKAARWAQLTVANWGEHSVWPTAVYLAVWLVEPKAGQRVAWTGHWKAGLRAAQRDNRSAVSMAMSWAERSAPPLVESSEGHLVAMRVDRTAALWGQTRDLWLVERTADWSAELTAMRSAACSAWWTVVCWEPQKVGY